MKYNLVIQYFGGGGGRSPSSIEREKGRGGNITPIRTYDLVSEREGKRKYVDQALETFREVENKYGVDIGTIQLAELKEEDKDVLAFFDAGTDGIYFNDAYFNNGVIKAYKMGVKSGHNVKNGKKSPIQTIMAHELGHKLLLVVSKKLNIWNSDNTATRIVNEARANIKARGVVIMASKISKYATHSNAEAVAEAYADVYSNGAKAAKESHAIVDVLNKYLQ